MTNPDLSAAAFSEFASRHTFDEIFDGRATPPAAVVPGTREVLEKARQEIVLTIAFLGRDAGSERLEGTVTSLISRLAEADKAILAALSAPVPPADGANEGLANQLQGAIDFSDKFNGIAKIPVKLLSECVGALRRSPSGTGAAEPVAFPDYEAAARALGYQQIQSGTWFHPNQHPSFTERFTKAEEIFDRYFGKHWLLPVREDREAFQNLANAMRFVLAFYEPGQRHLDTNAWKNAETGARFALKEADAILSLPVQSSAKTDAIAWAASRWTSEVANRPLQNVHRRALDTTWRQVIRHFGGDPDALCGPSHDQLMANEIHSSDGGGEATVTAERPAGTGDSLAAALQWDVTPAQPLAAPASAVKQQERGRKEAGVAPGPSETLSSAPVKKYAGNHSVALQFLFENETDGCPNCRGCAEHRCSSAPEATVSGEALVEINDLRHWQYDTSVDRPSRRLARQAADEIERLWKIVRSSPQDVGREATIEECAVACDQIERAAETRANGLPTQSPGQDAAYERASAANTCAQAIRSLFRKGGA